MVYLNIDEILNTYMFNSQTEKTPSTNNSHLLQDQLSPKRLLEDSIVTVAVKRVDSSEPATGTVLVNIEEEW
ncbi:MAG: hypothetical protein ABEI13_01375 [Candidatus Paceibacteria bacterium]